MNASCQRIAFLTLGLLVGSSVTEAQFLPAPPVTTNPRLRVGPFELAPTISLTNVGVDTNLFNEADVAQPERDLAMTLSPQTDLAARAGRTWLIANARQDVLWFRQHRDQRSANGFYRGTWYVPLNRVRTLVEGSYLRARERQGFEIDLRADRRERGSSVATEIRASSRTFVGGRLEYRDVKFQDRNVFGGRNLSDELSRTRLSGTVSLRYEMTPITSLAVEASAADEQFAVSRWRNTSSTQLAGGLRFDPTALIKGHVLVGYREIASSSGVVPGFIGPTLSLNLSSIVRSNMRVGFESVRDVEYSFDPEQPYYVLSGVSGTVTRRVFGPVDAQARVGWRTLAYRVRTDVVVEHPRRRDRVVTYAGGFGYRLGSQTRVTFDVESQRRTSPLTLRNYSGNRYGLSLIWAP